MLLQVLWQAERLPTEFARQRLLDEVTFVVAFERILPLENAAAPFYVAFELSGSGLVLEFSRGDGLLLAERHLRHLEELLGKLVVLDALKAPLLQTKLGRLRIHFQFNY